MTRSFDTCLALLTGADLPRVWSLIVTIFGDMARGPTDELSSQTLNRIAETIGLRPEAMRVALHRLRSDGWLASERVGRFSYYRLTDQGRAESDAASLRIYATHAPQKWYVILSDPSDRDMAEMAECHGVRSGMALTSVRPQVTGAALVLEGRAEVPDWLRASLCAQSDLNVCGELFRCLSEVSDALPETLDPVQTAALRVLVVHRWRRVILRMPDLPDDLFPDAWQGPACRSLISALLARLPSPGADSRAG